MSAVTNQSRGQTDGMPGRPVVETEARTRTINVEVPETVYWHVRKCATESRLSMKEYMTMFCQEAWPYSPEEVTRLRVGVVQARGPD